MPLIALFTDYGFEGPYVGLLHAAIHAMAPDVKVIDLMHDAPRNDPRASAYLLAALAPGLPAGTMFCCVVDPGVGSGRDEPVVMDLDDRLFVGPDNGLFDIAARRAARTTGRRIRWRPADLSHTFHGRDLYGPVCAMLAGGKAPDLESMTWRDRHGWPDDPAEIVYIDRFGNCMTGIRNRSIETDTVLIRGGRRIRHAETFAKASPAEPFWHGNSIGLVEIAVNGGSAADMLRLKIGSTLRL